MTKLPGVTAKEVLRKLRRAGLVFDRHAKGSHEIWFNPTNRRRVTVPCHPGNVPTGTLRAILRAAGLSVEQFVEL
jgi:predicted RNA binding protein YcfA (HicA-like mRNA interferase family)